VCEPVCGAYYVAFGENYYKQCLSAIELLHKHCPKLPVFVVTNQPPQQVDGVSQMAVRTPDSNYCLYRVQANRYTPFGVTVLLDTDTAVRSPRFGEIFDGLRKDGSERHGTALAESECGGSPPGSYFKRCHEMHPFEFPLTIWCPGTFAFRSCDEIDVLFQQWEKYWDKLGRVRDQAAFALAVQTSGANIKQVVSQKRMGSAWDTEDGGVLSHYGGEGLYTFKKIRRKGWSTGDPNKPIDTEV